MAIKFENTMTPSNIIQIGLLLFACSGLYYTLSGDVKAVEVRIGAMEKIAEKQDTKIDKLGVAKEDTNSRLIRIEERLISIAEKLEVRTK